MTGWSRGDTPLQSSPTAVRSAPVQRMNPLRRAANRLPFSSARCVATRVRWCVRKCVRNTDALPYAPLSAAPRRSPRTVRRHESIRGAFPTTDRNRGRQSRPHASAACTVDSLMASYHRFPSAPNSSPHPALQKRLPAKRRGRRTNAAAPPAESAAPLEHRRMRGPAVPRFDRARGGTPHRRPSVRTSDLRSVGRGRLIYSPAGCANRTRARRRGFLTKARTDRWLDSPGRCSGTGGPPLPLRDPQAAL